MRIFTQHMGGFQMPDTSEVLKICAEHPECVGCPLANEDKQIGNSVVRCENAFEKRGNNNG